MDLYKEYRPTQMDQIWGQDDSVEMVQTMIDNDRVPSSMLFTGPSGTGKTTFCRILASAVGCDTSEGALDFVEINAAEARGIDEIRSMQHKARQMPLDESIVFIIDECHKLTKDAQTALLKMLEADNKHLHYFLASTEPDKLLNTIRNRCTIVTMNSVDDDSMIGLTQSVVEAEGLEFSDEVFEALIEQADGSPRKALVLLDQIRNVDSDEKQLSIIDKGEVVKEKFESLARVLMGPAKTFKHACQILKLITKDEVEQVRHGILGYASACMINGCSPEMEMLAAIAISNFQKAFYDSGKSGLVLATYDSFVDREQH